MFLLQIKVWSVVINLIADWFGSWLEWMEKILPEPLKKGAGTIALYSGLSYKRQSIINYLKWLNIHTLCAKTFMWSLQVWGKPWKKSVMEWWRDTNFCCCFKRDVVTFSRQTLKQFAYSLFAVFFPVAVELTRLLRPCSAALPLDSMGPIVQLWFFLRIQLFKMYPGGACTVKWNIYKCWNLIL